MLIPVPNFITILMANNFETTAAVEARLLRDAQTILQYPHILTDLAEIR
jgi:hypothetical protein